MRLEDAAEGQTLRGSLNFANTRGTTVTIIDYSAQDFGLTVDL